MRIFISLMMLSILVACPSKSHRTADSSFPVTTDSRVYRLKESADRFDAYAIATYRNHTSSDVYFARCKPDDTTPIYSLERTGPTPGAPSIVGVGWACVGGSPSGRIAPGRSISIRVWLGSAKSPHANPPDRPVDRVGTFRILLDLCKTFVTDSDFCVKLPDTARESNTFEIRFAAGIG